MRDYRQETEKRIGFIRESLASVSYTHLDSALRQSSASRRF